MPWWNCTNYILIAMYRKKCFATIFVLRDEGFSMMMIDSQFSRFIL